MLTLLILTPPPASLAPVQHRLVSPPIAPVRHGPPSQYKRWARTLARSHAVAAKQCVLTYLRKTSITNPWDKSTESLVSRFKQPQELLPYSIFSTPITAVALEAPRVSFDASHTPEAPKIYNTSTNPVSARQPGPRTKPASLG
ncbi:hypothetical protein EsH8_VII_000043 [Colletotrichum jinshuiense]